MHRSWPAILTLGWILMAIAAAEAAIALFSYFVGDGEAVDFFYTPTIPACSKVRKAVEKLLAE